FLQMRYIGICMSRYNNDNYGGHLSSKLPDEKMIHGLAKCCYTREYVKLSGIDIIKDITNMIREGYYVYLYLDEYFMPNRDAYQKFHLVHDNLIYGFDSDEEELFVLGYMNSQQLPSKLSYNSLRKAFKKLNEVHEKTSTIEFFKPGNDEYLYSKPYFLKELLEYKSGLPWLEREDCYYGRNCFRGMTEYYSYLDIVGEIDIRVPYKFLEHKKLLSERMVTFFSFSNFPVKIIDRMKRDLVLKSTELVINSRKYNKNQKLFSENDFISKINEINVIEDSMLKLLDEYENSNKWK
ncbi:BtrH N-terminal domain-containing protein, partial [Enterococcus faecalis]|nr:BtrH N-terminal domain-containing protein [Enterococcus faecalis]